MRQENKSWGPEYPGGGGVGARALEDRSSWVGLSPFPECSGRLGTDPSARRGTLTSLSARFPRWHQSRTNPNPRKAKINDSRLPRRLRGPGRGRSGEEAVGSLSREMRLRGTTGGEGRWATSRL
ncbi:hypothetical protein P7K49_013810 [Saguinus oedipus]|uniref:Uncharacterized protein n=1 Tax=Saguinus oedipus TaxID=9490 RepID=A0ABQ9VHR5_SAGOE|nr:hypothetical protein P7K49_013810 [Saguinus oedipus]